ncbi:MAG: universal stress protein [Spirosomataceae bacterium]
MKDLTIQKILVPLDYSDCSFNALRLATAMSKRHKAPIKLLYVADPYQYISISNNGLMVDFSRETIIKQELNKLQKVADRYGVSEPVECRIGNVSENIIEAAHDFKADLLVMGTHGTSGIREFFMGSDAYKAVKMAPCPVLTVPQTFDRTDFKEILFPIRPIDGALEKYELTRKIIRKNQAHLTVFAISREDTPQEADVLTEMLDQLMVKLRPDTVTADIERANVVHVADAVIDKSQQLSSDLIVITAELDDSSQNFLIGPYAQQIINQAKIPVLSIRPQPYVMLQWQPANDSPGAMPMPL